MRRTVAVIPSWVPRGKRRLHKRPIAGEINACHVWLEREIEGVKPRVMVALGATALRALTGATVYRRKHASGAHSYRGFSGFSRPDPGAVP